MELEDLKSLAAANPEGPAALRLKWLRARAIGASPSRLIELIQECRDRNFVIPEIDMYVEESLARYQERLERARKTLLPNATCAHLHAELGRRSPRHS
jgi:hypothetical protein